MKNIKKILFSTTIAAVIFIVSSVPALGSPGGVWIEPTSTGIKVVSSVSALESPGGWIEPTGTDIKVVNFVSALGSTGEPSIEPYSIKLDEEY